MEEPRINISIPTFNREYCLGTAIEAALGQTYPNLTVTVVDDASTDGTRELVGSFLSDHRLSYVRLDKNVGTAKAKNVALALSEFDAITFHDSDDVPTPQKVLLQARAMFGTDHRADGILDWESFGYACGQKLEVDVVVGAHRFIRLDGSVQTINRRIALVDDFFPNLQFPSKGDGDWILINSGLFRRRVFEELGGFMDSVEEDRELRNRTIARGCVYCFIEEPLLTKVEMQQSLTRDSDTGYAGERRRRDRSDVWRRSALYKEGTLGPAVCEECAVALDLSNVTVSEIQGSQNLRLNTTIPASPDTWRRFKEVAPKLSPRRRARSMRSYA